MKKYLIAFLIAIIATLQVKLWSGDGSILEVFALNAKINKLKDDINTSYQNNELLKYEIANLKADSTAIEEAARVELGMIKPGESFFQVVEPVL